MVKNNRRRRQDNKDECETKKVSHKQFGKWVRAKMVGQQGKPKVGQLQHDRIKELLDEATLQCPICLQLLLKPVLAECGHIFCLSCAEDLAKNDYACGICHNHETSYDLTIYRHSQQLINMYLSKCSPEERQAYQERSKAFEQKQSKRKIEQVDVGQQVDLWCVDQKCWKSAIVDSISEEGEVTLTEPKSSKSFEINLSSRRLARHRFFTKEEAPTPPQPTLFHNFSFGGINRAISPFSYGMPMFVNMLGHPNEMPSFGGSDSSEFFGFFQPFRPFTF